MRTLRFATILLIGSVVGIACAETLPTAPLTLDPDLSTIAVATGFDFPVASGQCASTERSLEDYRVEIESDFLDPSYSPRIEHTGEDWNRGGGDTDLNDPVCAVGGGIVVFAGANALNPCPWGNVILVKHRLPGDVARWSAYAHLSTMLVTPGTVVARGRQIGTIGRQPFTSACSPGRTGPNSPHLHFEIRKELIEPDATWSKGAVADVEQRYVDPSDLLTDSKSTRGFIEGNRFYATLLSGLCSVSPSGSDVTCGAGSPGPGYLGLIKGSFPTVFVSPSAAFCGSGGTYGNAGFVAGQIAEFMAVNGTAGCNSVGQDFWVAFFSDQSGPYDSDHVVGYLPLRRHAPGVWTASGATSAPVIFSQAREESWSASLAGTLAQFNINTPLAGALGVVRLHVKWKGAQSIQIDIACATAPSGFAGCPIGSASVAVAVDGESVGEYMDFNFSALNLTFNPVNTYVVQIHNQNLCSVVVGNNCVVPELFVKGTTGDVSPNTYPSGRGLTSPYLALFARSP